MAKAAAPAPKMVRVSGINRSLIRGSFLIAAFARVKGERLLVGTKAVLSRWSVQGCANCQTHLEARAHLPLHGLSEQSIAAAQYEVEIHTRDGVLEQKPSVGETPAFQMFEKQLCRIEVR